MRWSAENYPAEKYALVVWNHGASWYFQPEEQHKGISVDYDTGNIISISNGDFATMLEESNEILGQKLEVLGMDACIMQSWEIAYEAMPYANYVVASQDYEGYDGWNYEGTMADLVANPLMRGEELGASVGQRFIETGDRTQSTLDMSQFAALNSKMDAFAEAFLSETDTMVYQQAVERSYSYDGEWGVDHDLRGFLSTVVLRSDKEQIQQTAQAAIAVLDSVVTSNYTHDDISGANGLSIYTPPLHVEGLDYRYLQASWSDQTLWDDMLRRIFEHR